MNGCDACVCLIVEDAGARLGMSHIARGGDMRQENGESLAGWGLLVVEEGRDSVARNAGS